MNYKCVEIPEPDFDASFTDEMVVTAYQDEDDFNPQMTDEYPNIRLTQLETDIQQTSLTAAEALETANNAEELASQASQAATTATESANAAGSLAAQASQSAQQAAGIAEGAATTAGIAAQSINTHATATTNPHPTNVTQEFADTQITDLATEATYTPTVWSYLVGLFTAVPKSVLQHLVKLWGVVNDLAVRVGLLEDNLILELTVTEDTYLVEITQDKNGNPLNLTGKYKVTIIGKSSTALASNVCTIGINDITSNSYYSSYQATGYNGINFRGGTKSLYFDFALTIAGGGIAWNGTSYGVNDNLSNTSSYINGCSLDDVTINSITKLAITFKIGSAVISNGTKIKITRF